MSDGSEWVRSSSSDEQQCGQRKREKGRAAARIVWAESQHHTIAMCGACRTPGDDGVHDEMDHKHRDDDDEDGHPAIACASSWPSF